MRRTTLRSAYPLSSLTMLLLLLVRPAAGVPGNAQEEPNAKKRTIYTIGGNTASARLTTRREPLYPDRARDSGISGMVLLNVVVDESGKVESVTGTGGHPALIPSAVEAVQEWRYEPISVGGKKVPFQALVTVQFLLSGSNTLRFRAAEDGRVWLIEPATQLDAEGLKAKAQSSVTKDAILETAPGMRFDRLEPAVRSVFDAGFKRVHVSHYSWRDNKLYRMTRNPGANKGPEIDLSAVPGIVLPPDGLEQDGRASTIYQVFAGQDGSIDSVLQWSGPARPDVEKLLPTLRLKTPVPEGEAPVRTTFYLQVR